MVIKKGLITTGIMTGVALFAGMNSAEAEELKLENQGTLEKTVVSYTGNTKTELLDEKKLDKLVETTKKANEGIKAFVVGELLEDKKELFSKESVTVVDLTKKEETAKKEALEKKKKEEAAKKQAEEQKRIAAQKAEQQRIELAKQRVAAQEQAVAQQVVAEVASAPAPAPATAQQAPAGSKNAAILNAAYSQLGRWQDCTMLVTNSLRSVGIQFHDWPAGYLSLGTQVPYDQAQPGDLVYYANGGMGAAHVAVYAGNGQAIHGGWNGNQTVVGPAFLGSGPVFIRVH